MEGLHIPYARLQELENMVAFMEGEGNFKFIP